MQFGKHVLPIRGRAVLINTTLPTVA